MIMHQTSVLKRSRLEDGGANPRRWNLEEIKGGDSQYGTYSI